MNGSPPPQGAPPPSQQGAPQRGATQGTPPPQQTDPAASGEAPAWGAELISMAEMCNEGTEYACTALSSEEAARLAWLAKQDVASPSSRALR